MATFVVTSVSLVEAPSAGAASDKVGGGLIHVTADYEFIGNPVAFEPSRRELEEHPAGYLISAAREGNRVR